MAPTENSNPLLRKVGGELLCRAGHVGAYTHRDPPVLVADAKSGGHLRKRGVSLRHLPEQLTFLE